jgi:putative two-component system response regulator
MRRTLLVVDDIKINREILRAILEDEYDILEAGDGREALKVMSSCNETLSAVLLDLVMPVMDGFELLEYMRKDAYLKHLPVIITTAQSEDASELRLLSWAPTISFPNRTSRPLSCSVYRM